MNKIQRLIAAAERKAKCEMLEELELIRIKYTKNQDGDTFRKFTVDVLAWLYEKQQAVGYGK